MRTILIALVVAMPLATTPAIADDSLCKKLGGGEETVTTWE